MKYLLILVAFFIKNFAYAQVDSNPHVLFEKIKHMYQAEVASCDSFVPHINDKEAKGRIDFLNKDFSTTVFNKFNSVSYWSCSSIDSNKRKMHIGLISILFKNEAEREAAERKIKAAGRPNFKVKLLTRFKLNVSKNELLIIYSETRNKTTSEFMEKYSMQDTN